MKLCRAVQPAYPSDIVFVICPLFMPLRAFRIPVPYLPFAALKTTRSHRADFATGKYTGECLIGLSSLGQSLVARTLTLNSSCSWTSRHTADDGASWHRYDTATQISTAELFLRRHLDRYSRMILSKRRPDECSSYPPSSPFRSSMKSAAYIVH